MQNIVPRAERADNALRSSRRGIPGVRCQCVEFRFHPMTLRACFIAGVCTGSWSLSANGRRERRYLEIVAGVSVMIASNSRMLPPHRRTLSYPLILQTVTFYEKI